MLGDLGYSARSFLRTPALALTLLLTIALGIGSNGAVLGFMRGLITRNLPLDRPETLVSAFARGEGDAFSPVTSAEYRALTRATDVFESVGAIQESPDAVEIGTARTVVTTAAITAGAASILQLSFTKGVVVSESLARSGFADTAASGNRVIGIAGTNSPVGSVAPAWLQGVFAGRPVEIWRPMDDAIAPGPEGDSRSLWVLGRLRAGVSLRQAQVVIDAARTTGPAIAIVPYTGETPEVASRLVRVGRLLLAAAAVVFVVACANVAVFLLSRASSRSQETSVRVALGAGRRQLGRQLLADSVLIAAAGTVAGIILAMWTAGAIPAFFYREDAAQLIFTPDSRAILIAAVVCAAIVIVTALLPLVELRDDRPADVLRREGRGPSNAMRRLRAGLVAGQMTCCCLLVISAGLLIEGFRTSLRTTRGAIAGQSLVATVQVEGLFARPDLGRRYFEETERAAQRLPDVTRTAWVGTLPGSRPAWIRLRVELPRQPTRQISMAATAFSTAIRDAIELKPVAGRMFGGRDTPTSCPALLVNEDASTKFFDGDPIGRVVEDLEGRRLEIVGVVAARSGSNTFHGAPTAIYYPEQMAPPLDRGNGIVFTTPEPPPTPPATAILDAVVVSSEYFDVMGFVKTDGRPEEIDGPCRGAVLNREAAERFFGGNAVGGAVIDDLGRRTAIVGVIESPLLRASQRRVEPTIYLPMSQNYLPRMTMLLTTRTRQDVDVSLTSRALGAVSGGGVISVMTLDDHLSRTALAPDRIATFLVGAAAAIALLIGVLGMYGAMADATRQRRREIALRIALGAPGRRIVGHVLSEGVRLAVIGAVAGMTGSLLVAGWISRIAPDAGAPAIWVWIAAPLALVLVVIAASVIPARRALAVNPLTIMQE